MFRLTSLAMLIAMAGTAHAQSQAELAEKLNEEGKQLMYASNYAEASKKFQQAVARVPEAKYFFNLCVSRTNEGALDEAITACHAVDGYNPTAELKGKTEKMVAKLNDLAKSQNHELHDVGGGSGFGEHPPDPAHPTDPSHPPDPAHPTDPSHPPDPAHPTDPAHPANPTRVADNGSPPPQIHYAPPSQNLAVATGPDSRYTWTLGVDLFGGGGQMGQTDAYGSSVGGFRIKGDYLFDPARRFGAQGYIQYSHLGQGKNDMITAETLDIVDLGFAVYKHLCFDSQSRLCATPLIGAQVALMSPAGQMDGTGSQLFNYLAVGGRAEISLSYAFGRRNEHALSLMAGLNAYSQVLQGPADSGTGSPTIADAGLDKGGALGYFGLGYTYRFNTPLGSSPFITLE